MAHALLSNTPRVDEPDPPETAPRSAPAASAPVATLPLGQGARPVPALLPQNAARAETDLRVQLEHFLGEVPGEVEPALRGMAEAWGDAVATRNRVWSKPDPHESDLGREAKIERTVRPRLTAALERAERTLEGIRKRPDPIAEAAAKLAGAGDDPTAELRRQEIRSFFRALPDGERRKAMREAIDSRDVAVLGAVLGAPGMLSGFGPAEFNNLRHSAVETLAPEAAAAAKRKEILTRQLEVVVGRFRHWTATAFPPPRTPAA